MFIDCISLIYLHLTTHNVYLLYSLQQPGEVEMIPVFSSTDCSKEESVNASIVFLSPSLCLFSHGVGDLKLLSTQERTHVCNQQWQVLASVFPCESPYSVLSARLASDDQSSLDIFLVELQDPSPLVGATPRTNPNACRLSWLRLKFFQSLSSLAANLGCEALKTEMIVCSVFESASVPLYCEFVGNLLLVINQSELRSKQIEVEDTRSVAEMVEGRNKQEGTLEEVCSDEEMETRRYGIGYSGSQGTYSWTQTDSDVTVTADVPTDVTKRDVSVIIERTHLVVGLSDGTTYVRGTLFGKVDVDTSTWTLDGSRLVRRVLLAISCLITHLCFH